jgi:hypothetical protein
MRTARAHIPAFCAHNERAAADGAASPWPEFARIELDSVIPRGLDHRLQAGMKPVAVHDAGQLGRRNVRFCVQPRLHGLRAGEGLRAGLLQFLRLAVARLRNSPMFGLVLL